MAFTKEIGIVKRTNKKNYTQNGLLCHTFFHFLPNLLTILRMLHHDDDKMTKMKETLITLK
jgi:hypothetical protein